MNSFFRTTILLMLIANTQWAFILANYTQLKEIEAIESAPVENRQETYLNSIFGGVGERWNVTPHNSIEDGVKRTETTVSGTGLSAAGFLKADLAESQDFQPEKIVLPAINKEAPIISSFSNIDDALNRGVVVLNPVEDDNRVREGLYIFGHSSSSVRGPYQYVFTKLQHIKRGEIVAIESRDTIRIYKLVGSSVKFPAELVGLPDSNDRLYLITCYPFLTSYKRYVAEFRLSQTVKKPERKIRKEDPLRMAPLRRQQEGGYDPVKKLKSPILSQ